MNKKGFTLIEIIVSVGLLALIGVAVGISLNKTFKNQEKMNYQEYVDKVKSAALLYANNTTQIINDLNSNASFKILKIGELINNGYINKDLENPETKAKIKDGEEVRIYYNENNELVVEYPYNKSEDDVYLYTMNYSITYKNPNDTNLCYKDINKQTLQLIKSESGTKVRDLTINSTIKAYMEDGSVCSDDKINVEKVGTYKIRYEYTTDGKTLEESENKKTAERTITVKPSKPIILSGNDGFKVQNIDENNMFLAKFSFKASDTVSMKYCIVATKIDETGSVKECSSESNVFKANTWINFESDKLISKDIEIDNIFPNLKNENEIRIFLYIKNDFEEYSYVENEYKNKKGTFTYLLTSTLILNLNTNSEFDENTKFYKNDNINGVLNNEIGDRIIIFDLKNTPQKTKFKQAIDNEKTLGEKFIPITKAYSFVGWYYDKQFNYKVENDDEIFNVVNVYAKWEKDIESPSCELSLKNRKIIANITENDILYNGWNSSYIGENSLNKKVSFGSTKYYVMDYALNQGECEIDIVKASSKTESECTYTRDCMGSRDCDPGGSCCVYGPQRVNECHDVTKYYCSKKSYKLSDNSYCWKSIS